MITYYQNKASGNVIVGLKVPGCNWYVLNKLIKGEPCNCPGLADGSELTAAMFVLYKNIQDKLMGTPTAIAASSVAIEPKCNYQNGEFLISFITQNNKSKIRKSLGLVMAALGNISYSDYSFNIRLLNGTPKRDEYFWCVNNISAALSKANAINAIISGNLGSKPGLDELTKVVKGKLKLLEKQKGNGSKPTSVPRTETSYPTLKASGFNVIFVQDYINSRIPVSTSIHDNKVIVYIENFTPAQKNALKKADTVEKYVKGKITKKANYKDMLIHYTIANCITSTANINAFHKSKPTNATIKAAIIGSIV